MLNHDFSSPPALGSTLTYPLEDSVQVLAMGGVFKQNLELELETRRAPKGASSFSSRGHVPLAAQTDRTAVWLLLFLKPQF